MITRLCEGAVERLASALPGREVACLRLLEGSLRHVAHRGSLRFIFELPRELGGVVWRAVETGETQEVPDVALDPDYVASDDAVTAEIATPVVVGGRVVAVLDVESTNSLGPAESAAVRREGARLAEDLCPYFEEPASAS